jgi:hypothetical protein
MWECDNVRVGKRKKKKKEKKKEKKREKITGRKIKSPKG